MLTVTTAPSTPPGSYPLTITGTSGSLSHVAPLTLIVDPSPDFTISASPSSTNTPSGGTASYTATVDPVSGFGGDVALSVSGLPADATVSFNPSTVTGGLGSSQLTVTTAGTTPSGSYPLTITATSGSLSHTAPVTLTVDLPPDFTVSAAPSSAGTPAGGSASYTTTVGSVNGFGGDVALSVSGLPADATVSFNPSTVAGGSGSSQLTVTTASTTPSGSHSLTITGTSGSLSHSEPVTLTVTPPDVTAYPAAAVIQTGTLRAGGEANLGAADALSYDVNSSSRVTAWYGSFQGVPNGLTSLKITYQGKNSRTCVQVVGVRRVTDGAWVQLDSRNVGTTEVLIADRTPTDALADYVSGLSGDGELRVRVRCSVSSGSFFASGNLMKIVYMRP